MLDRNIHIRQKARIVFHFLDQIVDVQQLQLHRRIVYRDGQVVRDVVAETTRPVRELKGFQKIYLEPGERRIVAFEITPELMSHYNSELKLVAESGEFIVYIGPDSRTKNSASFVLK